MSTLRWAIEWYSKNKVDGESRHLMWKSDGPYLFRTHRDAKDFIKKEWGYVATRPDLQGEPHGWRLPRPVRVRVELTPL